MTRNIVIFSDGTGQVGGLSLDERRSNIYKLYRATRIGPDSCIDPSEQAAYYDAGLGSRPPEGGTIRTAYRAIHNFFSQATGFGLTTNIIDCYSMIIKLWRPGDRIFLFGFSRGAYTVRCLGGVLAHCGIPTHLEGGAPMRYDSATARRVADIAVRKVYQHTASRRREKATDRQKEVLDQRAALAHQFCETYGARQDDKSEYPYFIGVFDTVSAIANKGALAISAALLAALAAGLATVLWAFFPAYSPWFGSILGEFLAYVFGAVWLDTSLWWHWVLFVVGLSALIALIWYLKESVRFAPSANPKKPWRTLHWSLGRMRFDDRSLGDDVRYARHAISIDEDRASFPRVPWGEPGSSRPDQDEEGITTFQQYWFAGNHSDVGGSYPEEESRLSDTALTWMVEAAAGIKNGIRIDKSVLQLYPSAGGMQHDERKQGLPLLTKWFGLTWKGEAREIPNPRTTLHDSVYERFQLSAVLQCDVMAPYRPKRAQGS